MRGGKDHKEQKGERVAKAESLFGPLGFLGFWERFSWLTYNIMCGDFRLELKGTKRGVWGESCASLRT